MNGISELLNNSINERVVVFTRQGFPLDGIVKDVTDSCVTITSTQVTGRDGFGAGEDMKQKMIKIDSTLVKEEIIRVDKIATKP